MFKIVIIGCGNIAGGYDVDGENSVWPLTHAGAFSAHSGFEIVACCDPDSDKRKAFQEKWSIPVGVSAIEELGEIGKEIDVVSLCSPTAFHVEHLKTILDWKPKLLFCEKPIAPDVKEASDWVKRYEQAGIHFVVNHNRRWAPDICSLKEDFAEKKWGKIYSVSGVYNKGVLNNGGHMVDLIHHLLGPMRVIAAGKQVYDYWPDDPSVPALLETSDGVPITLNIADARSFSIFEVQFVTERGVLVMESGGMAWSLRHVIASPSFPGYRVLDTTCNLEGRYKESMMRAVDNIYKVLTDGDDVPSSGATAVQAQRICQEIRACAQKEIFY